jgi:putative oxidoreductase
MDDVAERARKEALVLAGRLLLAAVFLGSAVLKGAAFDPESAGGWGGLFWVTVLLELTCGGLLALGLYAKRAALVMLVWLAVGLVFFHGDMTAEVNRVFALANLGVAGGLCFFVAHGPGLLSLDHWLSTRAANRLNDAAT